MKLVISLLLVAAMAAPGHLYSMEFGFGMENGIQRSTCSAKFKLTYLTHSFVLGVPTAWNKTITVSAGVCCDGYTFRNGDCFPIDPEHPCNNVSCSISDAECVVIRRCGHKLAVFMKDDEIVRSCHPPGYLDLLTCSKKCSSFVCSPLLCPKLNHSEVVCDVIRGCSCKALWRRKSDGAVMDCTTGEVQKPCE